MGGLCYDDVCQSTDQQSFALRIDAIIGASAEAGVNPKQSFIKESQPDNRQIPRALWSLPDDVCSDLLLLDRDSPPSQIWRPIPTALLAFLIVQEWPLVVLTPAFHPHILQ